MDAKDKQELIRYYDFLADDGCDPVYDPPLLRDHMNKWDGGVFLAKLRLTKEKSVLEIGVGTGRLAVKTAPLCGSFAGIDISPKTIELAKKNLKDIPNVELVSGDFLTYDFGRTFDVICSSLTFMHIERKTEAFIKAASLLNDGGIFVLSTDKNQGGFIDYGKAKISVFPDKPEETEADIAYSGLKLEERFETEFAHIFVARKNNFCWCGHDCSKCATYTATIRNDDVLREKSRAFYMEQFGREIPAEDIVCCGGRSGRILNLCLECPFRNCGIGRGIDSCRLCPEYPCPDLKDYQEKYVNKCNMI
ncbi:MAG: methyltransferase domain-containing protein [Clostridiales bacterium]|jgi:SAM-dependent methyltransferase|nr:methyltransferase domain-containing protein [Clostridiales bacterium]